MIEPFNPGLQYYVDKINTREPFTFIRLGDGEWSAILQDRARTSSRSQTLKHKSLQQGMMKVIARAPDHDNYILALRSTSFNSRVGIKAWLEQHTPEHVKWHDCTVFYKASKKGQFYPFIQALRDQIFPIIVIGPERLKALDPRVFPIWRHVIIPGRDCWAQRERILARALRDRLSRPSVYLITAGPAAKVFCWSLFQRVGQQSWILDLGSLWDPYVGKRTRTYHKGMLKRPAIIKRNLTGQ